jgi:hypothetical protein
MFEVRTRYGWGWQIENGNWQSWPIESSILAQNIADKLNAGKPREEAFNEVRFENGRIYAK